jgi:hypothetical protein
MAGFFPGKEPGGFSGKGGDAERRIGVLRWSVGKRGRFPLRARIEKNSPSSPETGIFAALRPLFCLGNGGGERRFHPLQIARFEYSHGSVQVLAHKLLLKGCVWYFVQRATHRAYREATLCAL